MSQNRRNHVTAIYGIVDHHCSTEVAATALVTIEALAPTLRECGLIGEPTEIDEAAAPMSRFLALVGRNPMTTGV